MLMCIIKKFGSTKFDTFLFYLIKKYSTTVLVKELNHNTVGFNI